MSKYKNVIYGDTDSCYLTLAPYAKLHDIELDADLAVDIADKLQARLQEDLPDQMGNLFLSDPENFSILEPGREVVGRKMLSKDAKKRYALHVVNDEGKSVDKIKIIGMETKRSDTPKFIQDFLYECVVAVVQNDAEYGDLKKIVDAFRDEYRKRDPWFRGLPGRVKNLTKATNALTAFKKRSTQIGAKKPFVHYKTKSAYNTNLLMEIHDEQRWDKLRDGDKIELLYLKSNPEGIDAVAIRTGETYIPDWFKELPFDDIKMEEKLIDDRLSNVVGSILDWDFKPPITAIADIGTYMDDFYD